MSITATFTNNLRDYPVYFYNGTELLQETREYYGTTASYHGDETTIKKLIGGEPSDYYEFAYWRRSPDSMTDADGNKIDLSFSDPIYGVTYFYAEYVFDGYIEDDWATIIADDADTYGYGGKKTATIEYTYRGTPYTDTVEFEIVGKNHDIIANSNGERAKLTFRGKISPSIVMNSGTKEWLGQSTLDGGGWALSDMRAWLNGNEFFEKLPAELRNGIKTVVKKSDNGYYDYQGKTPDLTETEDKIFVASAAELNITESSYTALGQGEPYLLFTDNYSRKSDNIYWTRSTAGRYGIHMFCAIDLDGRLTTQGGGGRCGVIIYFCI
jgi:hypothetical protein